MTTTADSTTAAAPAPAADTTMMRIVHDALRRDLARARDALGRPEGLPGAQRRAIGAHLGWITEFLHAHHASEDDGLYPLVRERVGDAADERAVLDRMARGHQAIAGAVHAVERTASQLVDDPSDEAVAGAVVALDGLSAVLLPHLREEEDEAMPIVSRRITADEWQAIEQEHNLDGKSMAQLGFEGHWLIDDATAADRATVVGLVPPIPRFLLLRGFARRYRRHAAACWGPAVRAPRRVQMANRVEVTVPAGIDEVWDVVRDVTRVGEWSHECVGAEWLGGATTAEPGARFRGRNRSGLFRWGRVCEVLAAEPYAIRWRTVPTTFYPDSSEWGISLAPAQGGGTTITQHFRVLRAPRVLAVVYALMIPGHRERTAALTADLERLGAVAQAGLTAAPSVIQVQGLGPVA